MQTTTEHNHRRVLIVDQCRESRDVLRTILEHRGMKTVAASRAAEGLEMATRDQLDLIVLDAETIPGPQESICDGYEACSRQSNTPLVILGGTHKLDRPASCAQRVSKPYHYRALIRRIEGLLASATSSHGE